VARADLGRGPRGRHRAEPVSILGDGLVDYFRRSLAQRMGVVSIGPTIPVGPLDLCPFVRKTRDTRVEAHHVPAGQKTILAFQKGEQPNSALLSCSPQVVGFTIIPD
jgi:hypothetical protein